MARVLRVMRRFNQGFRTNDSIGYAYGIDHGTASMEKTCPP